MVTAELLHSTRMIRHSQTVRSSRSTPSTSVASESKYMRVIGTPFTFRIGRSPILQGIK